MNKTNIEINKEVSERLKYDPSNIRQYFSDIRIQLHCCHYWMIEEWEYINLASPFWRLYHNTIGDAYVTFNGVSTKLQADKILIIPPNTAFSSRLKKSNTTITTERHKRRDINNFSEIINSSNNGLSDHFFVHFNLGLPYDLIEQNVYTFSVTDEEENLLKEIKEYCINDEDLFNFKVCTVINMLILKLLHAIPSYKWSSPVIDQRIANVLAYIERHIGESITNKRLAKLANMAENSFARLFREHIGISIHQYIKRKRIDKSIILLHHSNNSIEAIANLCGFSDRPHFSRVFKEIMKTSPASYKKQIFY